MAKLKQILILVNLFFTLRAFAQEISTASTKITTDYADYLIRTNLRKQRFLKSKHDFDSKESLSELYKAGSYLIYDCQAFHFACVDELSYKRCQSDRKLDFSYERSKLSCAPLGKKQNEKKCQEDQTHHMAKTSHQSLKQICNKKN